MVLESKDDIRKRGLRSPDVADSLALTFAAPVQPKEVEHWSGYGYVGRNTADPGDWNPYDPRMCGYR